MSVVNSMDAKIGLFDLADEHKLGCTISWNVPTDLCVSVTDVDAAFAAQGLPNYKASGCQPIVRWKELVKSRIVARSSLARTIRPNECRHPDKDVVSYEFSVNIPSTETETARLVPVGTMSIRKTNSVMWWRFTCGPRLANETIDEYAVRNVTNCGDLSHADCIDFANHAESAIADSKRFGAGPCHSAGTIKQTIKLGFEGSGGFSVASRGGFWFLPRLDGVSCPYTIGHKIAAAVSSATGGAAKFTTMNVPKDTSSVQGATEVVHEDFFQSLANLETEVAELETLREGQNDLRLKCVGEILAQVQI